MKCRELGFQLFIQNMHLHISIYTLPSILFPVSSTVIQALEFVFSGYCFCCVSPQWSAMVDCALRSLDPQVDFSHMEHRLDLSFLSV